MNCRRSATIWPGGIFLCILFLLSLLIPQLFCPSFSLPYLPPGPTCIPGFPLFHSAPSHMLTALNTHFSFSPGNKKLVLTHYPPYTCHYSRKTTVKMDIRSLRFQICQLSILPLLVHLRMLETTFSRTDYHWFPWRYSLFSFSSL